HAGRLRSQRRAGAVSSSHPAVADVALRRRAARHFLPAGMAVPDHLAGCGGMGPRDVRRRSHDLPHLRGSPRGTAVAGTDVRPIVIARDLTKTFPLHHHRVLSLKERVMNAVRGRTGSDEPFVALNHISFEVAEGESVALVGRNGSGKSTLLKMIAGIHHATGGKLLVRSGKRIATMIELGVGFHPDLSGRENVHLNAAIHGLTREQIDEIYPRVVAYAELEPFMDNALKTYSSGM